MQTHARTLNTKAERVKYVACKNVILLRSLKTTMKASIYICVHIVLDTHTRMYFVSHCSVGIIKSNASAIKIYITQCTLYTGVLPKVFPCLSPSSYWERLQQEYTRLEWTRNHLEFIWIEFTFRTARVTISQWCWDDRTAARAQN